MRQAPRIVRSRTLRLGPTAAVALLLPAMFATAGMAGAMAQEARTEAIVLVTNSEEDTLSVFDAGTLTELARIPTGRRPHEVVASADGRLAFVTNYGTGDDPGRTLSVIDLMSRKEARRVTLGPLLRPHGIDRSGSLVYFTAGGSRAVGRYDADADAVDWIMGTGQDVSHLLVVTRDGRRIFVASQGSDVVTALQFADGPPPRLPMEQGSPSITHIPAGSGPEALDLSPDGNELWVGNHGDGTLTIIDAASHRVKETIPKMSRFPIRLKFTPDGRRVLVTDLMAGELIVLDAAARRVERRIPLDGRPLGLAVAADGGRAFVVDAAGNRLIAVDLQSLTVLATVPTGQVPDGVTWVLPQR
jgi:YVTN family beta-propeller protein